MNTHCSYREENFPNVENVNEENINNQMSVGEYSLVGFGG